MRRQLSAAFFAAAVLLIGGGILTSADAPAARRAHVFVSGLVQGVGFRAFVKANADELKLTGWVKNLADGRVEAVIEGPAGNVAALIEKLKRGPAAAKVDKVDVADEKPTGEFKTFDVRTD